MSGRRRAGVLALATAAGSLVFPPAVPRRRPAAALCRRPLLLPLRVATAEPEAMPADVSANATAVLAASAADGAWLAAAAARASQWFIESESVDGTPFLHFTLC